MKTMPGVEPDTMPAGALAGGADGRLSEAPGRATNLCATVERLALRTGLSEREKTILTQLVSTDFTVGQIATVLSAETGTSVTEVAVKHTIERVMNKLAIEPRTRATLIRFVLERCHAETARGTRGWVE